MTRQRSSADPLEFYKTQGPMTDPGPYSVLYDALPSDIPSLVRAVQGLCVDNFYLHLYSLTLDKERESEADLRSVRDLLAAILNLDASPLSVSRVPNHRVQVSGRHFATLLTSFMRAKGIPTRARCGFGNYFEDDKWYDHWVVEWWDEERGWCLVDPLIDEPMRRSVLAVQINPLDLSRDRFMVAGEAWVKCQKGEADPMNFGIVDIWGVPIIMGNLMRDIASLNRFEVLPWDIWKKNIIMQWPPTGEDMAFIDSVAEVVAKAHDKSNSIFTEIRLLWQDNRVRVDSEDELTDVRSM